MSFILKNTSEYIGKKGETHWWSWTASIEATGNSSINDVKYVEYQLHSSFKNPVKRIRNSETGFAISAKGWGTFLLRARIMFKDLERKAVSLEHVLEFVDGDKEYENI